MKRLLLMLTMLFCLLAAACGDSAEPERPVVYRTEAIPFDENFAADPDGLSITGDRVYVTGYDIESNLLTSEMGVIFETFSCGLDGSDSRIDPLGTSGGGMLHTVYTEDGGRLETETFMSGPDAVDRVTVSRYGKNGELLCKYDCADVFGLDPSKIKVNESDGRGGFFVHAAYKTDAGLLIVSTTGAAVMAADGTRVSLLESKKEILDCAMDGERLILIYRENSGYAAYYADYMRGELADELTLPDELVSGRRTVELFSLDGYVLALRNADGVYGFMREEETGALSYTMLCDFAQSGIVGTGITDFAARSPDCFFVMVSNSILGRRELYRLSWIPAEELAAKKELTVAYLFDCDTYARQAAADMNLASDEYLAKLRYYAAKTNEHGNTDYAAVYGRLDLDIAAGDVPDVLVMPAGSAGADLRKYIDAGLFADLYPLIDADTELDRSDFTPLAKKIGETDGKLLFLPTEIRMEALISTDPALAGKDGMTLADFVGLIKPDGSAMRALSPVKMVNMLDCAYEDFIDTEADRVSFDTPAFRKFVGLFSDIYTEKLPFRTDDGEFLLVSCPYADRPAYVTDLLAQHGEDLTFIGYPDTDGSGIIAKPEAVWAISSVCEEKEAALELIKKRLRDEYLYNEYRIDAPLVTVSTFRQFFEKYEKMSYYYHGGVRTLIEEPITAAEAAKEYGEGRLVRFADTLPIIRELLQNAVTVPPYAGAVGDIVYEELVDHAVKQLSVDETTRRISKRVGIYVSEQYH